MASTPSPSQAVALSPLRDYVSSNGGQNQPLWLGLNIEDISQTHQGRFFHRSKELTRFDTMVSMSQL